MIYFDESGNSGPNLLDPSQPTYLLISHNFSESESRQILNPLLDTSKAKELHFKQLKKYEKSKKAIIECINHPLIEKERVFQYVAHKEFMIIIQIVDQLIEHVFYKRGEDIYKGGFNISTANILYIMGKNVWDKKKFNDMCVKFVVWMRSKERNDGIEFYGAVQSLYKSVKHEKDRGLISLILESLPYANEIMRSVTKYTLDATLSCFNAHCHYWANVYQKPFDVIFDDSKQIEYWKDLIKFLTESLPKQEVGYGSRKHTYPLLINSLRMQSSDSSIQIQLADVLASSLNYNYSLIATGENNSFREQIDESLLIKTSRSVMWPGTEMTPEELDMTNETGVNPLDFISESAMKNQEAYKKAMKK